jgi:hypothetical protein
LNNGGNLFGYVGNANSYASLVYTLDPIPGLWYHAAFTFDNVKQIEILYLNGVAVASNNTSVAIGYDTHPVLIGTDFDYGSPVDPFNGFIDEASIYNQALSGTEVASIYNAAISGKCPIPPDITEQPQSLVVNAYDTAPFSVTASGTLAMNYQWTFNDTNIPGAISNTLTITNVTQCNLGNYAVIVSNYFGSVTSSNATLSMYPYITTPFAGAVTYWGKDATLTVQAWGTGPLSYQWFDNGSAVANATNQTLTLTSIQATNGGLYSVVVSNAFGSTTNPPEQVVVEPAGVAIGLSPTLTISGVVGYNYVIQSTTDLGNTNSWVTVTNLTLTQPVQIWVDTNVDASQPGNPYRYYQVLAGQ